MGLDMYLTARLFLWTKDYDINGQNTKAEKIKSLFPETKGMNLDYVIFQAGYWRKANQIHKWFVDNIQEGKDECQESYVSRDSLKKLLSVCKDTLKNKEKAKDIIPSQSGFFFGGTDYDEYFFKDIERTVKIIEKCLKFPDKWEFNYRSNW